MMVLLSEILFCLNPAFGIKLSGGNAAPFTSTVEYRLALGENISSYICTSTKLEGYGSS